MGFDTWATEWGETLTGAKTHSRALRGGASTAHDHITVPQPAPTPVETAPVESTTPPVEPTPTPVEPVETPPVEPVETPRVESVETKSPTDVDVQRPIEFGAAIRSLREAHGLSAEQLAAQIGVAPEWVTTLESGRNPDAEFALVAAALTALGVELKMTAIKK
jgi:DNA-binding XRE family transcriptional regulator